MAAGQIIDEDSELALRHAIAARRLASRIAVVREAVGLAAYAAGDWTTAIAELRTYHRMTGRQTHLAELADCERALGRPERAIDLFRGADIAKLEKAGAIELLIVAAGARGDLGQHDAAVAMLQVRELTGDDNAEWAARLRYAYADALLAAGRRDEAREWFARTAAADEDQVTDAAERLLELDGVTIEGDDADEDAEPLAATADRDGPAGDEQSSDEDDLDDDENDDLDDDEDDDLDDEDDDLDDDEDDLDDDEDELVDEDDVREDDGLVGAEGAREDGEKSGGVAGTGVNTDGLGDGEDAPQQVGGGVTGSPEKPAGDAEAETDELAGRTVDEEKPKA